LHDLRRGVAVAVAVAVAVDVDVSGPTFQRRAHIPRMLLAFPM